MLMVLVELTLQQIEDLRLRNKSLILFAHADYFEVDYSLVTLELVKGLGCHLQ
jgi:hypothetical protein